MLSAQQARYSLGRCAAQAVARLPVVQRDAGQPDGQQEPQLVTHDCQQQRHRWQAPWTAHIAGDAEQYIEPDLVIERPPGAKPGRMLGQSPQVAHEQQVKRDIEPGLGHLIARVHAGDVRALAQVSAQKAQQQHGQGDRIDPGSARDGEVECIGAAHLRGVGDDKAG
jgi:hypothetical protein